MTDTTGKDITALELKRLEAMCNGDVVALETLLASDFVYTHANGNIDSKQSLIDRIAEGKTRHSNAELVTVSVRQYGDSALSLGHFTMLVESPTYKVSLDNLFLGVWVRSDEGWKQVALQSSLRKKQ